MRVGGGVVITGSAAIVLCLAEKYPQKNLLPTDIKARAQVFRWLMFAVTELEQPLWRITRNTALLEDDKRVPQDVPLAREDFIQMAAILERHMEGRSFIVGDAITAADCVTAYLIDWANELGLVEGKPNLQAYLTRMYGRPRRRSASLRPLPQSALRLPRIEHRC